MNKSKSWHRRISMVTALVGFVLVLTSGVSTAFAADPNLCYAVADYGDRFVSMNRHDGSAFTDIGAVGVTSVEAIGWDLSGTTLYAANAGTFGTINQSTGAFTAIGSGFGTGSGSRGDITFSDVDGLATDPTTGIMYGSHRANDGAPDDVLIQINVTAGAHVPDAFGTDVDYVVIDTASLGLGIYDVDDLAIDPIDGQMYAVANTAGGDDRLVKVDKETGAVADVGRLRKGPGSDNPVSDMEGFSFYNDGTFYGTTGQNGDASTNNRLWEIDKTTGIVTEVGPFDSFGDYEAVGCLVGGSNAVSGTVFKDNNGNGILDGGDVGEPNVTVYLYIDEYGDGQVDAGDTHIQTATSDGSGEFSFEVARDGDFVMEIDQDTLPPSATGMSTDNVEVANFTGYGNSDTGNDFGYVEDGSIGDYIWLDLDGDGEQDSDEPGLTSVEAELDNGSCALGSDCPTVTTDADGFYRFPNLDAGTYTVIVTTSSLPSGVTQTGDPDSTLDHQHTVTLAQGQAYDDADFGYQGSASIGDYVWNDADGDGVQDAGESGIDGVSVDLYFDNNDDGVVDAGDTHVGTQTTSGGGAYDFTDLPAGDYLVDVTDTGGVLAGKILAVGSDPHDVALSAGEDYDDADFGYYDYTTIGKGVDKGVADPGDTLSYTLFVSYDGAELLSNAQVADSVPSGTTYVGDSDTPEASSEPAGGGTGDVVWDLGSNDAAINGYVPPQSGSSGSESLTAIQDAFIRSDRPYENKGDYDRIKVDSNKEFRGLVEFDLDEANGGAGIPDGATISNGLLKMEADSDKGATINIHRAITDWAEGTVTWSNWNNGGVAGTDYDGTHDGTIVDSAKTVVSSSDMTGLVQEWHGGTANEGILLISTSTDESKFFSKDEDDKEPPKLEFDWQEPDTPALNTALSTSRTLVSDGETVTVNMTLYTTTPGTVDDVTAGTLTVNGFNSASASCGAATLASVDDDIADTSDSVIYTWTCTVSTGNPTSFIPENEVTFEADASGDGGSTTFATGTSNSVLAIPSLTFQVTVNDPVTVSPVTNQATFSEDDVFPGGVDSNIVETKVGSSIGDYVWDDADENGEQDDGEDGLANITVWLYEDEDGDGIKDPEDDLLATASTDSNGNYDFTSLASGNYIVDVDENDPDLPDGAFRTTDDPLSVSLAPGQDYNDADFGFDPPAGPTAVTLCSFGASSASTVSASQVAFSIWPWLALAGLLLLAMGWGLRAAKPVESQRISRSVLNRFKTVS